MTTDPESGDTAPPEMVGAKKKRLWSASRLFRRKNAVNRPTSSPPRRWTILGWMGQISELDSSLEGIYSDARSDVASRMELWSDNLDQFLAKLRIPKRLAGMASEGLTLLAAGIFVLNALAIEAKIASNKDWKDATQYSLTFLDRGGQVIGTRGAFQNASIALREYPPYLVQAVIATEDRRFYDHWGFDIVGTLRALSANITAGGLRQGGSTLTQQIVKNFYLTNERTLSRKITEIFLSMWIEFRYRKEDILKLYLDYGYLGNGAFGVEAAAQVYFGKSARDVNLAEAAMLAGLFKAPSAYAPHVNLKAAQKRAADVLSNMVEAEFITQGQAFWALNNPAKAVAKQKGETLPEYFLDWAYDETLALVHQLPRKSFIVRTSLSSKLQAEVEKSLVNNLKTYGEEYGVQEGAAILMQPDGAVLAMTGGRDYGYSQFNRAVEAKRQPGSSFKPFIYIAALISGYSSKSIIVDEPITIGGWSPQNYTRNFAGAVSLTYALSRSINTAAVRLAQNVGRRKVIELAHEMGIESRIIDAPSLALGTSEVSLLELVGAYAPLANGGRRIKPFSIVEVRGLDQSLLYERGEKAGTKILSLTNEVREQINTMMHDVVANGTGARANIDGLPVIGKTGTTQSYRDAWFIGATGDFVAGVWYGNDDFSTTNRLTGGTLPASTWSEIISYAQWGSVPKLLPGLEEITTKSSFVPKGFQDNPPEDQDNKDKPISRMSVETTNILRQLKAYITEETRKTDTIIATSGVGTEALTITLPPTGEGQ